MSDDFTRHHFTRVEFYRFKAFERFSIHVRSFNILVGPNNAGKSTILVAFRILSAAFRRAQSKKPEYLSTKEKQGYGYVIDLSGVSVAEENIYFNYDDSVSAKIDFYLSNSGSLCLLFPEKGRCLLFADHPNGTPKNPAAFKKAFNCIIGFVPILGPVEHNEQLFQEEAARLALYNYTAARNFRNIWHHYPEQFERFRKLLQDTWPSMDIKLPEKSSLDGKIVLHMFCTEERIAREIFWAGFGFQVWCQMLTHLVQAFDRSLFIIDEPDIYLHSDLQRHLVSLLRNLGPDIIIATHSTEIITEAEPEEIVIVDKKKRTAKRIRSTSELADIFLTLGSHLNPVVTQLSKTKKVLFVEGKDFQILSKIARKLGCESVARHSQFAVVPVQGFNPERIKVLKEGMEKTLGSNVRAAAILDRDYRSDVECEFIKDSCKEFCEIVNIHLCKEIENFLLVPSVLNRVALKRLKDRENRDGQRSKWIPNTEANLLDFSHTKKAYVFSQRATYYRQFERKNSSKVSDAELMEKSLSDSEKCWSISQMQLAMIPGKEALSYINLIFQEQGGISVTPTAIIEGMRAEEVSPDLQELIQSLEAFSKAGISDEQ